MDPLYILLKAIVKLLPWDIPVPLLPNQQFGKSLDQVSFMLALGSEKVMNS